MYEFVTTNNSHKSTKCIIHITFNISDFSNMFLTATSSTNKDVIFG